eukprot:53315-Chlamydomonas_euryale.AAC.1
MPLLLPAHTYPHPAPPSPAGFPGHALERIVRLLEVCLAGADAADEHGQGVAAERDGGMGGGDKTGLRQPISAVDELVRSESSTGVHALACTQRGSWKAFRGEKDGGRGKRRREEAEK